MLCNVRTATLKHIILPSILHRAYPIEALGKPLKQGVKAVAPMQIDFPNIPVAYTLDFCFLLLQIDHFGFSEDRTFKQRYLIADQHWRKDTGAILFYTGNEGDITWFANNTVRRTLDFFALVMCSLITSLALKPSLLLPRASCGTWLKSLTPCWCLLSTDITENPYPSGTNHSV